MENIVFKDFEQSFSIVNLLEKGVNATSLLKGVRSKKAKIKIAKNPCKKGYNFEFSHPDFHIFNEPEFDELELNHKYFGKIVAKKLFVARRTMGKYFGAVGEFGTMAGMNERLRFFRQILVIPQKLTLLHYIEDESFRMTNSFRRGKLPVQFDDSQFDVFVYEGNKNEHSFLIIDSLGKIEFEKFSSKAYFILIALGFVTGKFFQNEGYYFGFDSEAMAMPVCWRYTELRDSKNAFYHPIYANSYGVAHRDMAAAEEFYPKLKPFPASNFSMLCVQINEDPDFQALMVLLLEVCGASLLLMPAGFSVVLEGLTNIIKGKPDSCLPQKLAKSIRDEMHKVIATHKEKIPDDVFKIFTNRINDLNSPTNPTKLISPFKKMNIQLREEDLECLKNRNEFLHGKISLGLYAEKEDKKAGEAMYYNALRFYTLISALVLKYVGFSGWIINHAKVHEKMVGQELEESFFIEI